LGAVSLSGGPTKVKGNLRLGGSVQVVGKGKKTYLLRRKRLESKDHGENALRKETVRSRKVVSDI